MQSSDSTNQVQDTVTELLQLIRQLVSEFHPNQSYIDKIGLDSRFDKDLGLDSLTRVELISRVEKHFKLALPEITYAEAVSARDLIRAIKVSKSPEAIITQADIADIESTDANITTEDAHTLIDVLNWHVATHPDRAHIQFYADEGTGEIITYAQLKQNASRVAGGLQQRGLKKAEPVVLMLPSNADYFYCFFGILIAGGIPVPIYPPARLAQIEDHMHRHIRILSNCKASIFITVSEAKAVAQLLKSQAPDLHSIITADELISAPAISTPPVLIADDIAFLQYTSGSTGNPKGVMLSHANLLANLRAMGRAVNAGPSDVFVSWLPLYHDMGLIGSWLGSLYFASRFVVMSPLYFLSRPERWLWAIHRYHGTLSASPNFGYEFCVRRLKDEDIKNLDLSSWRAAFNGAEPVSPETMQNFSQRFAEYGFNKKAMMPVYGLAESSVGLAFPPLNRGPLIDVIDRDTFMRNGVATPANQDDNTALKFVSSGPPLMGHQIRVIDSAGHELPERHEGLLEFHGPSSTSGYYRDAQKTQSLFDKDWVNTGDLAYIANGELFITGRVKDIIIRAGRNIYPHELEDAVGNITGIRTGRVAVFGSEDKHSKTERLIVMAETRSTDDSELEILRREINSLATDLVGSPADEVVLCPPGSILKTSSGKIRRTASRELYEKGEIGRSHSSIPMQIARITISSILPQLRRSWRYTKALLYAGYCWFIYSFLAIITWLCTVFIPSFRLRWAIACYNAKLFKLLTGTRININGLNNIPGNNQPYVLVCNHASYLDSYVLMACIPGYFRFIAKEELARSFYNRLPLKNIHTEFVNRFDTSKSLEDTQRLVKLLKERHVLVFFAEGTFTRIPGLRPFHLGAFSVATEARVPVLPVAIRGTRSILRSGSWFPHYGHISIDIGEAIEPEESSSQLDQDKWHTAIKLRNKSRSFILQHCGEPDLIQDQSTIE